MKITVIGAGIWGSSTAYYLRKQGAQVQLVDMWGPGNTRSGSGGASRIIRLVYGPDDIYIDLTSRSFELWAELFENNERDYYQETGLIWLFSQGEAAYALDSKKRITELGFELEEVDLHDASTAYHQISFDGVKRVFFEDKAGILYANKCCELMVSKFQKAGGHYLQGYASVTTDNDGFLLQVNGKKIEADRYVFACGPWTRKLFPDILQECTYVSKHDVYHFVIPPQKLRLFEYHHLPVWLEYDPSSPLYYGMPMHLGKGFKIAYDDRSDLFDPDIDDRLPSIDRLKTAREFVHRRFPLLMEAPISYTEICQYDNSRDGHFIVDHHDRFPNVILMTGSSGHGFKMGPALGEIVAKHLLKGTGLPEKFKLSRFTNTTKKQSQFLP
jgi:glycine/D-amino acid oxidase-like deaminating enzyme